MREGTFVGTPLYVAPEMLEFNQAGTYTDLWALGCIIYELIEGVTPFSAKTSNQVFQKILEGKVSFPKTMDPAAVDLISKLLKFNPTERLGFRSIAEIKEHHFFEGIDFEKLEARQMDLPSSDTL